MRFFSKYCRCHPFSPCPVCMLPDCILIQQANEFHSEKSMIYIFLIYVLEFRYLLKSSFYDHNILSLYRSNFSNSISQVRICEKILFSESFLPPPPFLRQIAWWQPGSKTGSESLWLCWRGLWSAVPTSTSLVWKWEISYFLLIWIE